VQSYLLYSALSCYVKSFIHETVVDPYKRCKAGSWRSRRGQIQKQGGYGISTRIESSLREQDIPGER